LRELGAVREARQRISRHRQYGRIIYTHKLYLGIVVKQLEQGGHDADRSGYQGKRHGAEPPPSPSRASNLVSRSPSCGH
jgi:hypothetical protein